jgi:hypothetical protein
VKRARIDEISLGDLQVRGAQVWRSVRLVPLVRPKALSKIRLGRVNEHDAVTVTTLDAHPSHPSRGLHFVSVVPHSFVVGWGEDAEAEVNQGAALVREGDGRAVHVGGTRVRMRMRMARRASDRSLRFAPQQLAIEGLLSLYFGGPSLATRDWSERLLRRGLDPRTENAMTGRALPHLAEALRVFEVLDGQCGMLLFFKDMLFGAFVAPTHEDYRALHDSLVLDLFPAELLEYASYDAPVFHASIEPAKTLSGLRAALEREEASWAHFYQAISASLLTEASVQHVHGMEGFELERFITRLHRKGEHHIGERIVARDGTLAYLKTYRLGAPQARRAFLLDCLGRGDWDLDRSAEIARSDRTAFIADLRLAGFEWMLGPKVLHELRGKH